MIKLIRPYITFNEVKDDFKKVFDSGRFSQGENVSKFNDTIKKYTKAKCVFSMTSATTSLSLCLKILGVKSGEEVIVSDFSFPATSNVVEDLGAKPVFADIDLRTFNMLPEELERKINPNTRAVIFVDALGNPSGISKIKEICKKNNLPLIEDAACAIGSSVNGVKCGNISDLTCFSFHPRKLVTTGEGGAITTNNETFAKKIKVKLNHGAVLKGDMLDFIDFGYNFRLSELQAVMGIKQIDKLDKIIKKRSAMYDQYTEFLKPLGFKPQEKHNGVIHNIQSAVFLVPEKTKRNKLINYLKKSDVESTIGTYSLSALTYYRNKYNNIQKNSKYIYENSITLPCHDNVDVEYICEKIKNFN